MPWAKYRNFATESEKIKWKLLLTELRKAGS